MKTIKSIKAVALLAVCLLALNNGQAQVLPKGYFNVDWQVNFPIGNDFASKASGWGMNFEGGSWIGTTDFAIGGFLAYHTNNEYIDAKVISVGQTGSLYTDQQHSLFQLPFGVSGRYRLTDGAGVLDPYLGLKMGAEFARFSTYYSTYETYDNTWGFYLSPEIGTTIYPFASHYAGLHIAAYFSYATNKSQLFEYDVKSLNNFGLRLGVTF